MLVKMHPALTGTNFGKTVAESNPSPGGTVGGLHSSL
jgi:hypothetical protein